jgi:hypothetical protein
MDLMDGSCSDRAEIGEGRSRLGQGRETRRKASDTYSFHTELVVVACRVQYIYLGILVLLMLFLPMLYTYCPSRRGRRRTDVIQVSPRKERRRCMPGVRSCSRPAGARAEWMVTVAPWAGNATVNVIVTTAARNCRIVSGWGSRRRCPRQQKRADDSRRQRFFSCFSSERPRQGSRSLQIDRIGGLGAAGARVRGSGLGRGAWCGEAPSTKLQVIDTRESVRDTQRMRIAAVTPGSRGHASRLMAGRVHSGARSSRAGPSGVCVLQGVQSRLHLRGRECATAMLPSCCATWSRGRRRGEVSCSDQCRDET